MKSNTYDEQELDSTAVAERQYLSLGRILSYSKTQKHISNHCRRRISHPLTRANLLTFQNAFRPTSDLRCFVLTGPSLASLFGRSYFFLLEKLTAHRTSSKTSVVFRTRVPAPKLSPSRLLKHFREIAL